MAIKKTWYEIIAPKMFDEQVIGETPAVDSKQLIGRTMKISLMDISKDHSKFYIKLNFQIERIDGKAYTRFVGHECMPERIYRMVQRRMRRVDCVQDVKTSDGFKLRVKSILIIPRRVGTSIKDAVRAKMKNVIDKIASEKTIDEIVKMIISDELQKVIREECKKIYPIGVVEIRKTEVL